LANLKKAIQWLFLAMLVFAGTRTGAAQGSNPAGEANRGLEWKEVFEGSTDSSGQVTALTSSATYRFGEHFSMGAGIPLYFNRSTATTGTTTSDGVGNLFATAGASWKGRALNYGTSLTGSVPTGDSAKGLSTGHATFDWNNRFDQSFSVLTPFVEPGVGNTISDTPFFHRPFTSFGYLAHFEGGTDVDLSHSLTLTLSGYDIAPRGTQTIFSRAVGKGATGSGGQHGRVFQTNHQTTGGASINQDNGFTAGLNFSPKSYLDLHVGYTRSVKFAFNAFSWGIGVNLSKLFSGKDSTR
jgi:hypothetical protein